MRKLVTLLLAAAMTMAGVLGVAAQDNEGSYGSGLGDTTMWIDDRGNEIATLEVTDIVVGWDEFDENGAPERGYDFVAVRSTVTNISDGAVEIEPNRFSLVDSQGLNNSRAYVRVANPAESGILEDAFTLEAGASQDFTVVFQIYSDVTPAMFVWQPDSGVIVMVSVDDSQAEESAVALGLNIPAVFSDERGNVVGSIEVTQVEDDWQDYDDFYSPERGTRHVAVHFSITNLSDAPFEVNPFNLSLLDSESTNNGRSYANAIETAEIQVTSDTVDIAAGESFDGMLVYTLYEGVEPTALMWQPGYGTLVIVVLEDSGADADIAATPAEDVDATPEG